MTHQLEWHDCFRHLKQKQKNHTFTQSINHTIPTDWDLYRNTQLGQSIIPTSRPMFFFFFKVIMDVSQCCQTCSHKVLLIFFANPFLVIDRLLTTICQSKWGARLSRRETTGSAQHYSGRHFFGVPYNPKILFLLNQSYLSHYYLRWSLLDIFCLFNKWVKLILGANKKYLL